MCSNILKAAAQKYAAAREREREKKRMIPFSIKFDYLISVNWLEKLSYAWQVYMLF